MSWLFKPTDDNCLDCKTAINPKLERNYIVWDEIERVYRRQCATCHDAEKQLPFNRKSVDDATLHSMPHAPEVK